MSRSGFGLWGLPSVAMVRSSDGLREQVVYLSPDSQDLVAAAIAAAIVSNPSGGAQASDEATLQASTTRASTLSLTDATNTASAKGIMMILNVTAVTALQTLTLNLQAKDPISGNYVTLATTGAIGATATATGTYILIAQLGVGTVASPLFAASVPLPYTYRAQIVHSGAGNFTYSLGRVLLH